MINDLIEVYCNVLTVTIINCFHPVRGVVNQKFNRNCEEIK